MKKKILFTKRMSVFFISILMLFSIYHKPVSAIPKLIEPKKARQIAQKMINRGNGYSRYNRVMLISCAFIKKDGKNKCSSRPRRKIFESISLDVGKNLKDSINLSIIIKPPSEKGVTFLQKDYDKEGKDSQQWMYLPALKKLKRIVSESRNSPKTGTFFGSEIAYEDMEKMHLSDYYYALLGEEPIQNRSAYILMLYPTRKRAPRTSYGKIKVWVGKKSYMDLKSEFYDKRGNLVKTMYAKKIVFTKGVYISRRLIIVNHSNRRMSMMKTEKMALNIPIPPMLLTPRAIKDASFRESKMKSIRQYAK